MGLLGNIIAKGVVTAATNSTIRAVGDATATVIASGANSKSTKEDVTVKNGMLLIKPTRSSKDYYGQNALEIARELLGSGFESVILKPRNTLSARAKNRYGKIEVVSINGKDTFVGVKKVPASSYIVIEYLDFKKNIEPSVYIGLDVINPGAMNRMEALQKVQSDPVQKISNEIPQATQTSSGVKQFCPYCGDKMAFSDAKFCMNCGKEI